MFVCLKSREHRTQPLVSVARPRLINGRSSACAESAFSSPAPKAFGTLGYDHSRRVSRAVRRSLHFTLHPACAGSNGNASYGRHRAAERAFPGDSVRAPTFVDRFQHFAVYGAEERSEL